MTPQTHNYASFMLYITPEFKDVADALGTDWFFRGQTDTKWKISSSLEREAERVRTDDLAEYEANTLREIKTATGYPEFRDLDDKDDFSWLALLQHHGCKTRLVDFTESFYIALYFAIRDLPAERAKNDDSPVHDAAVWAIRKSAMDSKITSLLAIDKDGLSAEGMSRRLIYNSIELPWRYEDTDNSSLAIVYSKPLKMSERMTAQKGLFLAPLNLKFSFMENLTKGLDLSGKKEPVLRIECMEELSRAATNEKVLKIIIPAPLHRDLLYHLRKKGISDATLFPGLDGFARSLNYYATGMD